MYTPDFERRGILPVLGGSVVLRNNAVSTFSLDVNGDDLLSARFEHGWRVVIEDRGVEYCAGAVTAIGRKSEAGVQDLTISGADDMAWLRDMITLPNPANKADNQAEAAYYKAKGSAETLIADLVRTHVGQSARSEYRRPLYVETPTTAGAQVQINSRFKTVLEEVETLARGRLNVHMRQDDEAQQSVMTVDVGRDLARAVRLTEINGGITSWDYAEQAPTVTSVLVAGQGEGEQRTLKLVDGNENDWGFWALQFQDRRDTDELAQLIQAGEETLEEGRETATVSMEIGETPTKEFGPDFWLGDTITVQLIDGATITDIVQSAEITWDATGRTVKLTIGPVLDEQDAPRWVKLVQALDAKIRALQTR
jgi:hypothetical protein